MPNPQASNDATLTVLVQSLIQQNQQLLAELNKNRANSGPSDQITGKVIEMMGQASGKAVELASKQNDPAALVDLITKLKGGGGGESKLLETLLPLLLKKVLDPPAQSSNSSLIEALDLLERIESRKESSGKGNGWLEFGQHLVAKIPDTLQQASRLFQAMRATPGAAAAPAEAGMNPAPAEVEAPAEAEPMNYVAFIGQKVAAALDLGLTGDEFAEKVEQQFGTGAYDTIAAKGKDGLLTELQGHGPTWALLTPHHAALPDFVDQFLEYGKPAAPPPAA